MTDKRNLHIAMLASDHNALGDMADRHGVSMSAVVASTITDLESIIAEYPEIITRARAYDVANRGRGNKRRRT